MNVLPVELVWHIGSFLSMVDHIKAMVAHKDFTDDTKLRRKRFDWFKNRLSKYIIKDELEPGWCGDSTCCRHRAACIHVELGFTQILSCYCSQHSRQYYYISPLDLK